MDNFTKHRLNDEAIRRAQERASHRKPSHPLPGDPKRTSLTSPAANRPIKRTGRLMAGPLDSRKTVAEGRSS
jgi:hypothetical protein